MKKLLSLAVCILAVPSVLAAKQGMITSALEAMFDAAGSDVFVKLALWLVLFTGLYFGAKKAFPEDTKIPAIISVVISFIAIRFMPVEWMGAFKSYLYIAAILLIPYFLVSLVFAPGWTRRIFYVLSVLGLWYLVSSYSFLYSSPRLRGFESLDYILYWFSSEWIFGIPFHWLIIIFIVVFLIILALFKRRSGEAGISEAGPSGPGLFSRLGDWMGRRAERKHDLTQQREQQQFELKQQREERRRDTKQSRMRMKEERQLRKLNERDRRKKLATEEKQRQAEEERQRKEKRQEYLQQRAQRQFPARPGVGSQLNRDLGGFYNMVKRSLFSKKQPVDSGVPPKPGLASRINKALTKRRSFRFWGRKQPKAPPAQTFPRGRPVVIPQKKPGLVRRVFGGVDKAFRRADKVGVKMMRKKPIGPPIKKKKKSSWGGLRLP